MAVYNFSGFFYIENDPMGKIDNSFGIEEDISNNPASAPVITYEDLLNKFAAPLVITYQNSTVNQKFIVDNFAYQNTPDDLSNINTNTDAWDKLFNIANFIYHRAGTMSPIDMDKVLRGLVTDDEYIASLFTGYQTGSVDVVMRADDPTKISKLMFSVADGSGLQFRSVSMWVNPQTFVDEFITATPYIFVYYTSDPDLERNEQGQFVNGLYTGIGRQYVNAYKLMEAPLYTASSGELQPFHIFTKGLSIPNNPLDSIPIANAIRTTIRNQEPTLTEEQLIEKYPTIFVEGSRVIWPLFSNTTMENYQINDPLTGNPKLYLSNPVTLATINSEISSSAPLQGQDGDYEIFTLAHKWYPFIAFGIGGALTDKIPKYRPILEDIEDLNPDDGIARSFNIFLTQVINYITGDTILNESDKTAMGYEETTTYVSFKLKGIEWRVYKRGYQTTFDTGSTP